MSYIGRNPQVRSITCEGFADFATADASTKREGRLVYVQDVDKLYMDNGAALALFLSGASHSGLTISNSALLTPTQLDMKQGLDGDLVTYALTATNGQLCFATDTKIAYQVIDTLLVPLSAGSGISASFWQKALGADLNSDGVIGDLAVTGLTIGKKYKVTLNVKAVRAATGVDEIQELSFSAVPTFGLFQIEFDGQTTSNIPYDASASDVQSAMEALSNIGAGECVVAGDFSTGFTFTFSNGLGLTDVAEITVPSNSLTSGESGGTNEQQTLQFSNTPTSGSFTITYDGETTGAILNTASNTDIKNALELLPNINGVNVTGTFGTDFVVEFTGSLVEKRDVSQVTTGSNSLEAISGVLSPSQWEFGSSKGNLSVVQTNSPYIESSAYSSTGGWAIYSSSNGQGTGFLNPQDIFRHVINYPVNNGAVSFIPPNGDTVYEVEFSVRKLSLFLTNVEIAAGGYNSVSSNNSSYSHISLAAGEIVTASFTLDPTSIGVSGFRGGYISFRYFQWIDYLRFRTTDGTIISEITNISGIAPTGGTGTTATPSTTQDGAAAVAGPSNEFGAGIYHDGSKIGEAKYRPSAQSGEDALASLSTEGYIDATATTLSVEGEGLGGAERLGGGDTRIIVEEFDGITEN